MVFSFAKIMDNKIEKICAEILKVVKNSGFPLFAVIDFDNTCIFGDITEATLAYLSENNLFKDKKFLGSFENYHKLLGADKIREAYDFIVKILSGFSVEEIAPLVEEVLKFDKDIKPREKIIELINFLKNNKVEVWIVSASPEILVKQAMKHFDINANLIGTRNIVVNKEITSKIEQPMPMFEGKVDCIKKFIDSEKNPLLGVGDSINDLSMLEYCKIKVVVDRKNDLSKIAKQNKWFLI
jgi:HAD superfamily phosphoserine phosphatase-like hydrolase